MRWKDLATQAMLRISALRSTVVLTIAASCLAITGCSVSEDTAALRVVELIDSLAPADAYLDDVKTTSGLGYETVGTYANVPTGEQTITLRTSDGTSNLLTTTIDVTVDGRYSAVLAGTAATPTLYLVDELPELPGGGEFRLQVLNAVVGGPAYDVFVTDAAVDIATVSPTISSTGSGETSGSFDFVAGTYRLRITTGAGRDLVFDSGALGNVVFSSDTAGSLVIYNGASSTLVKSALLTGAAANATSATRNTLGRIRLVNAANSTQTLNLRESGSLLFAGLPTSGASSYLQVDVAAGTTYTLEDNDSPPTSFGSFPLNLAAGEDHSLLASGTPPNVILSLIADDNGLPQSSFASLRTINGVSGAGNADVFVNFRRDFSAVGQNQSSTNYLEYVPATNYQFGAEFVNGAQLFDLGDFEIEADRVYTLLMYGPVSAPLSVLVTDR